MVYIASPIYESHEGVELRPYLDAVGVPTVCAGETFDVDMSRIFTPEECRIMTDVIMRDFGTAIANRHPEIILYPFQWGSFTIFSANVGLGAYDSSSIKRAYVAGDFRISCRNMQKYKYAGGRIFQGLINRREGTNDKIGEYELCLVDAIPRDLGLDRHDG